MADVAAGNSASAVSRGEHEDRGEESSRPGNPLRRQELIASDRSFGRRSQQTKKAAATASLAVVVDRETNVDKGRACRWVVVRASRESVQPETGRGPDRSEQYVARRISICEVDELDVVSTPRLARLDRSRILTHGLPLVPQFLSARRALCALRGVRLVEIGAAITPSRSSPAATHERWQRVVV